MKVDKKVLMPILKAGVAIAGVGITLAQSWFNKKELENVTFRSYGNYPNKPPQYEKIVKIINKGDFE